MSIYPLQIVDRTVLIYGHRNSFDPVTCMQDRTDNVSVNLKMDEARNLSAGHHLRIAAVNHHIQDRAGERRPFWSYSKIGMTEARGRHHCRSAQTEE